MQGGYGGYGGYGGIMDHGESIYGIIPPKPIQQEKPPMYRSTHDGLIPPTCSTFHSKGTSLPGLSNLQGDCVDRPVGNLSARTMGVEPGSARNNPNTFMRKFANTDKVPTLSEVKRTSPDLLKPTTLSARHKPSVPRHHERPILNLVTSKNFIVANAVENILATPRKVGDGAKDYLHKEDYGKNPKYLGHIKRDIGEELNYIRELQQRRDDMTKSQVRPMDEMERLKLIDGLKAKWEHVNTNYQSGTHLTKLDTIGKIRRKETYETELAQIEKDIARLNRKGIHVDCTM